ncbi:MAG: hypothetical protein MRY76_11865 [Pseudomonadales bacterium]|nr:hypothetical protein [Pseudomonadales bacterium]
MLFSCLTSSGAVLGQGLGTLDIPPSLLFNVDRTVQLEMNIGIDTPVQQVDLVVTDIDDPAGHSCCVIQPSLSIGIFLGANFEFSFSAVDSPAPPPWLNFPSMPLDDNLEFTGQSNATVAGYPNITTVVSGGFTPEGVEGSFRVGANGGLPGGQPITYYFELSHEEGLDMIIPAGALMRVDLLTSSEAEITAIAEGERVPENFYLSMISDSETADLDWWIVMLAGGEFWSFDLNTGQFEPGLRTTYQGPAIDVPEPVHFWSLPESLSGETTLFFGVDTTPNGAVDESGLIGTGYSFYFP